LNRISMKDVGGSEVLAGAMAGRSALGRLLELTATEPAAPGPLCLDFKGVTAATVSYLRESVGTYRGIIRSRDSHYYKETKRQTDASWVGE
jgi:hypothetical protein